ncbi:autotransporter domain-containing protein, partial [Polaromonas sp. SM01]|uniref:autotransporter domain-containing protein n=1 Tax=Polaromonas sp. SM01 TaxID=3085630 RepID=UPI00298113D0
AGQSGIDAYSLGAYWNHVGANGAYSDVVLMATRLNVDTRSVQGLTGSTRGNALTAAQINTKLTM